jgi:two-component system sensor kinase FixL
MLRFHSNILKSLMEGIYLVRASDGVIVFTNPQFESMFGYGHGELIGKHVSVVNAPGAQSSEAMAAAMMSEFARTGVWSGEVRNIRKDGTTFWCHASVSAFDHPLFGNVWVSVHEDITERKQFEEMRAKLANAGRFNISGETAASLTHELSQPLTACNNYLDVCLRRIDDQDWCKEKLRETLQLAYKQAGRAGEIINYFKKQVRRPELEYTRFDVNLLARDVMAFLAGEIKRQGVSMHMVLFHLPQVMACREEIRQVLLSLCENAIEAMHSSAQRELYVTTRLIEPDHVMVAVSDSGEGVLPARMKTLFEPFQTSREGGLGLSLSICRSIIEKHGGRIWADPQRESGAEFYFTLPIRAHHE